MPQVVSDVVVTDAVVKVEDNSGYILANIKFVCVCSCVRELLCIFYKSRAKKMRRVTKLMTSVLTMKQLALMKHAIDAMKESRVHDFLASVSILLRVDNRPPMLEKDMYDSWKSRMELYMMNRQHGRMILKSIENGPLLWPTVEENGVTRPKKYSELSTTEAIQADCDVNATNIILQGLPTEVYALVSNHKVAKELWE
nr:hypothetical protein [Tanacetum cinerariifolium]